MTEIQFKEALADFKADSFMSGKLWAEIQNIYTVAGRYYHNIHHLDHMINELLEINNKIADWHTLVISIAYHDMVYNVNRKDNEEQSAKIALARLSELGAPLWQKEKCSLQILATKSHTLSHDEDANYLNDADLAILGTDETGYQLYAKQIRKEYQLYPDLIYKPGRKKVLKHFLAMPAIYKTSLFSNKYENQARLNLENELRELS